MTTLDGIDRNRCPPWIGISVQIRSESLSRIIGIRTRRRSRVRSRTAWTATGMGHFSHWRLTITQTGRRPAMTPVRDCCYCPRGFVARRLLLRPAIGAGIAELLQRSHHRRRRAWARPGKPQRQRGRVRPRSECCITRPKHVRRGGDPHRQLEACQTRRAKAHCRGPFLPLNSARPGARWPRGLSARCCGSHPRREQERRDSKRCCHHRREQCGPPSVDLATPSHTVTTMNQPASSPMIAPRMRQRSRMLLPKSLRHLVRTGRMQS